MLSDDFMSQEQIEHLIVVSYLWVFWVQQLYAVNCKICIPNYRSIIKNTVFKKLRKKLFSYINVYR